MKILLLIPVLVSLFITACTDSTPSVNDGVMAELARHIAEGRDHATAAELADRLIRDRRDFELIDIRDEQDFLAGHIKGARNIPLATLLGDDALASLPAARSIVVYSNGSAHAAQAALLLRLTGRDALALLGGYNYWQAWLHDPEKAGVAEMDPTERARYAAVTCYFAGVYVAGAGLPSAETVPAEVPGGAGQEADPLGLGLGLGSEQVQAMDLEDTAPAEADPLGLGLGLGSEQVQAMDLEDTAPAEADPLGLGLGLGLGGDAASSTSKPVPPPKGETRRLLIRAEC